MSYFLGANTRHWKIFLAIFRLVAIQTPENLYAAKTPKQPQDHLFKNRFSEELNPAHELIQLGKDIPWDQIQTDIELLFTEEQSRLPLPVRLVTGLMILQHLYDVSDEEVVKVWVENPYWQAFCGYDFLQFQTMRNCCRG